MKPLYFFKNQCSVVKISNSALNTNESGWWAKFLKNVENPQFLPDWSECDLLELSNTILQTSKVKWVWCLIVGSKKLCKRPQCWGKWKKRVFSTSIGEFEQVLRCNTFCKGSWVFWSWPTVFDKNFTISIILWTNCLLFRQFVHNSRQFVHQDISMDQ